MIEETRALTRASRSMSTCSAMLRRGAMPASKPPGWPTWRHCSMKPARPRQRRLRKSIALSTMTKRASGCCSRCARKSSASTSACLRRARLAALRAAGIRTMATATNLIEALRIERRERTRSWRIEAGGHRGMFDPEATDERLSMAVLVRLLVKRTTLPDCSRRHHGWRRHQRRWTWARPAPSSAPPSS